MNSLEKWEVHLSELNKFNIDNTETQIYFHTLFPQGLPSHPIPNQYPLSQKFMLYLEQPRSFLYLNTILSAVYAVIFSQ
jgi:hypothetical protein